MVDPSFLSNIKGLGIRDLFSRDRFEKKAKEYLESTGKADYLKGQLRGNVRNELLREVEIDGVKTTFDEHLGKHNISVSYNPNPSRPGDYGFILSNHKKVGRFDERGDLIPLPGKKKDLAKAFRKVNKKRKELGLESIKLADMESKYQPTIVNVDWEKDQEEWLRKDVLNSLPKVELRKGIIREKYVPVEEFSYEKQIKPIVKRHGKHAVHGMLKKLGKDKTQENLQSIKVAKKLVEKEEKIYRNKIVGGLLTSLIVGTLAAGVGVYATGQGSRNVNPVEEYAVKKGLSGDIVNLLRPLGVNGTIDANTRAVIDEISGLGIYGSSPVVSTVVKDIVRDGNVTASEALWKITDIDDDGIQNQPEIKQYKTDPTNVYTSGTEMDDYNAIFTHQVDPNNATAVKEVLSNIPNVKIRKWQPQDGGSYKSRDQIMTISIRDPYMKELAKRSEIKRDELSGMDAIFVDGKLIHLSDDNPSDDYSGQPSYYFAEGRVGHCAPTALATAAILKLMGHDAVIVNGEVSTDVKQSHDWVEALIDGKVYVVNYSLLEPRDEFYDRLGWIPNSFYNPNWHEK